MEALLLRINEAAALLGVSRSHICRLIDKGEISAMYVGARSIRIKRSDIVAYIEKNETNKK